MSTKIFAAALLLAGLAGPVSAAPLSTPLAAFQVGATDVAPVENVQWRGGWRGGGWRGGWRGFGPGFAAGAVIGGLAASPYYYGYDPYAYGAYGDYGDDDGYVTVAPGYDTSGSVESCQRRFRSYDVRSGTYLGYDGLRHSCP